MKAAALRACTTLFLLSLSHATIEPNSPRLRHQPQQPPPPHEQKAPADGAEALPPAEMVLDSVRQTVDAFASLSHSSRCSAFLDGLSAKSLEEYDTYTCRKVSTVCNMNAKFLFCALTRGSFEDRHSSCADHISETTRGVLGNFDFLQSTPHVLGFPQATTMAFRVYIGMSAFMQPGARFVRGNAHHFLVVVEGRTAVLYQTYIAHYDLKDFVDGTAPPLIDADGTGQMRYGVHRRVPVEEMVRELNRLVEPRHGNNRLANGRREMCLAWMELFGGHIGGPNGEMLSHIDASLRCAAETVNVSIAPVASQELIAQSLMPTLQALKENEASPESPFQQCRVAGHNRANKSDRPREKQFARSRY